jgi:hypothetical protein
MMPRLYKYVQHALGRKILLLVVIGASLVYVAAAHQYLYTTFFASAPTIVEHTMDTNPNAEIQYWTATNMSTATEADSLDNPTDTSDYTQQQSTTAGTAAQQPGHPSLDGSVADYRSTVGKIFFSDNSGRDYVCSGTAVVSANNSVVDTAGHCLYWEGNWVKNVIFCPLYDHGATPYGCWAARALLVPADWQNAANLNDLHHDMGIAVVSPNDAGPLTDVVGGAGWAYNQKASQPFYAYGYPAGYPFDGQSQKSCEGSNGTLWQHGGGTVVSIPCNMTGGSSGGGWFIQIGGQWYLNGHNDFTSSMKRGHMFSPYYDDTWYAMYSKAQNL